MRCAIPFFKRMRVSEIEPRDVRKFIAHVQQRGVAANTVRLAVAPLRAPLATAVEDGLIRSNPCAGIRLSTRRADTDEGDTACALTAEEYARLLDKTPQRWLCAFDRLRRRVHERDRRDARPRATWRREWSSRLLERPASSGRRSTRCAIPARRSYSGAA
jgi:hypothetical protein